jgi:ERCC4-type nuclease
VVWEWIHVFGVLQCEAAMQDPISIVVDDREPSCVVDALRAMSECGIAIQHLALGDYQVDGRLLFERKTLPDFVASVLDGRLFRQAAGLAASPLRPIIILEGTIKDIANHGISREALQGALISATVMYGIPLLRSLDPSETARLMLYTARQVRAVPNGALPRTGKRPKSKRKMQLQILQSLPGVGPARAQSLLKRYGSVENVMHADCIGLEATPGIGEETAQRIRWAVNQVAVAYDLSEKISPTIPLDGCQSP